MGLSAKWLRSQLKIWKPFVAGCSLETARRGQDKLGELMAATKRREVHIEDRAFAQFDGAWIRPHDELRRGVILYLHGGGYTCGDLEYAKGFGSVLCAECGVNVFCAAYRLAPEYPFPAALEDALEAYRYLLEQGYDGSHIVLCGESAGGGLIYALCFRLRELGLPLPAGLCGISPWTDLTASGESYEKNRETDPSMTVERLSFFADHYTADRQDPLVSPLFGDLTGLPPSLLFVGGDEIMLDDARQLHERLLAAGCQSELTVAPGMWHGYLLYGLEERRADFDRLRAFLQQTLPFPRKLRWMRLDNAAKIYPAARRRNWSNVFRLSATLTEPVDRAVLQEALDVTVRRFPSIAVRLRRGMFWYYLEELPAAPPLAEEAAYPLTRMPFRELRRCAFRVIAYENRVAVEFFHSLTDGNGGLIFLKTLVAEYIKQKYGALIPATDGVLNRLEEPRAEELEDSFLKWDGNVSAGRGEATAYRLTGTPEADGFLHLTTLMLPTEAVLARAKVLGVSVTAFLCAVLMQAIMAIQNEHVPPRRQKPVKVLIPVDLRRLFGGSTLRNFVLYVTPGVDPRMGAYRFEEICRRVHHEMGMEITDKQMQARITTNVRTEKALVLKIMPLFIKNVAMRAVFDVVGERKSCLTLSNLGAVKLPEAMIPYVKRMDFVLGVQATSPYNCGVLSYNGALHMNFIRGICEPKLEARVYEVLRQQGIPVKAESNGAATPQNME